MRKKKALPSKIQSGLVSRLDRKAASLLLREEVDLKSFVGSPTNLILMNLSVSHYNPDSSVLFYPINLNNPFALWECLIRRDVSKIHGVKEILDAFDSAREDYRVLLNSSQLDDEDKKNIMVLFQIGKEIFACGSESISLPGNFPVFSVEVLEEPSFIHFFSFKLYIDALT